MPSGARLTIKDSGVVRVMHTVKIDLDVGILEEDAAKLHSSGMTLGGLAEVHEYGHGDIPARAPVRSWADQHAFGVRTEIREHLREMVRTQHFDMAPLQVVAQRAKATLVGRILGGMIRPKNKQSTLARKRPETRALVDSRELSQAMQAKITVRSGGLRGLFSRAWGGEYRTGRAK